MRTPALNELPDEGTVLHKHWDRVVALWVGWGRMLFL